MTIDLPGVRDRERAGPQVLRRVRRRARTALPLVRQRERRPTQVLRRVRRGARGWTTARRPRRRRPRARVDRAPARLGPVRRPRRVHAARRGPRRRGRRASSSPATSTPAATMIDRYGGTVEKFIGDAVMAVWGTPVAHEDDAERAVRAALELVDAVAELGPRRPALRRAPASSPARRPPRSARSTRAWSPATSSTPPHALQSAAEPGTVLVGEAPTARPTRRSPSSDAGDHELKGKAEPLPAWRALRVLASAEAASRWTVSSRRSSAATSELRLVKELLHATARGARPASSRSSASLGSASRGWPGSSRSTSTGSRGRLVAPGPLPAYGEGVAFWALAEMVRDARRDRRGRGRAGARARSCAACLAEFVPDADERALDRAPRLRTCSGSASARRRARRAVRRLAPLLRAARRAWRRPCSSSRTCTGPTRACSTSSSHLLEWSRTTPIFVLTLARPELADRRPGLGRQRAQLDDAPARPAGRRGDGRAPDGLVPGLPDDARATIRDRAEASPSMRSRPSGCSLDRGVSRAAATPTLVGDSRRASRARDAACAGRRAARRRSAEERALIQDAAVLGKSFTPRAAGAPHRPRADDVEPPLVGSSARRCSPSTSILARRSAGSTGSCSPSSSASPTTPSAARAAVAPPRRRRPPRPGRRHRSRRDRRGDRGAPARRRRG